MRKSTVASCHLKIEAQINFITALKSSDETSVQLKAICVAIGTYVNDSAIFGFGELETILAEPIPKVAETIKL